MELFNQWKKILLLALPSLFAFATQTLTGTICLIMVGDLGALIIGVVGVSNIIMYNVFAIFSGIGHSVSYLVAQNHGSNEMTKGIQRTYMGLGVSLLVGGIITLTGWTAASLILKWTGGSESLVAAGEFYLELRFYAMAIGMISFVFHGFFRGVGDTRISMVISIFSNMIIIALTYGLTYGEWGMPQLGLPGAGYAMLIGESVGLLLCLAIFWGPMHKKFQTRKKPRHDFRELALIGRESGKLGMMEFSMSISMFIFTVFVIQLGEVALAANEVALSIMSFGFMPAFAFGSTATTLVGQGIGAMQPIEARRAGTHTAILGCIFLLLLGTAELIWAHEIAGLYTKDVAVAELAAFLISVSAFLQIFDGLYNFYAGGLRGIGDTSFLMKTSVVLSWLLFVPSSYLFVNVLDWGSMGAWLSLYTFLTALGLSVMIRYYRTDFNAVRIKQSAH
jgi:MATE family multidrug resistance protein